MGGGARGSLGRREAGEGRHGWGRAQTHSLVICTTFSMAV